MFFILKITKISLLLKKAFYYKIFNLAPLSYKPSLYSAKKNMGGGGGLKK